MLKTLLLATTLATGLATAAHAQKFDNWQALQFNFDDGKGCGVASYDAKTSIDMSLATTVKPLPQVLFLHGDAAPTFELRLTLDPDAKQVPAGDVEASVDGQAVFTAAGAVDTNTGLKGEVLSVKLTPAQFGKFFDAAKTSHVATIKLPDGTVASYPTGTAMWSLYIAMGGCLHALMSK